MAAAAGVAHARGLPLLGIRSLDPVWLAARAGGAADGLALADAGRGAVYAMPFGGGSRSAADGVWARVELAHLDTDGADVYSADRLPIHGLQLVDPAVGLALAVTRAPSRPLRLDSLEAEYGGTG
jgi:tRNA A37 threonylcarbamoyladenosine modification protein TsaB